MVAEARRNEDPITNYDFGKLVFYDSLRENGLTLHFRSQHFPWFGIVVLEFGDALAWCPAGYVWVFCGLCGKFHFPPTGDNCHRRSKSHMKKMQHAPFYGPAGLKEYYLPWLLSL